MCQCPLKFFPVFTEEQKQHHVKTQLQHHEQTPEQSTGYPITHKHTHTYAVGWSIRQML